MKARNILILLFVLCLFPGMAEAQGERKYIRQGNKEYNENEFNESEIQYRKALDKDINSYEGNFNLGDALYKQDKYEDAARKFSNIADPEMDTDELSRIYHNLGNSLLKNNQLQESIEAYKHALRNNPDDLDTKHNLAYAQQMLQQQQQQQQQQQNQDENQEQQEQDQQNDQQNQQDQEQQEQQQQQQEQQQQQQQQQQQRDQITEEDARRMLEALQQDEKQLQEKLKKQKARAQRIAVLKDW